MTEAVIEALIAVKKASSSLRLAPKKRDALLRDLAQRLRGSVPQILAANLLDLSVLDVKDPKVDRLLLTEARIEDLAIALEHIASLEYPPNRILEERQRPNGLRIQKVAVPLGVVAVIYESRPNVTLDVFALCFKTGNACVLKGGKEAYHSNQCLVGLIHDSLKSHHIPLEVVHLLARGPQVLDNLLKARAYVDVCIPRGGQELIQYVREHAEIPIIETGAGIVHTYFDVSGDLEKGSLIIHNAKTRRVSVCNALDSLIVHTKCLADLPRLVALLKEKEVSLFADASSYQALEGHYPKALLFPAKAQDFGREFLSYQMAIKTVNSLEEAIDHIQQHSSGHSEAIIAEDTKTIQLFVEQVDAAAVYVNTSTAFTDGEQFGLGAEIGISTQKLHARGPMALEALSSYKWVVWGEGQVRP